MAGPELDAIARAEGSALPTGPTVVTCRRGIIDRHRLRVPSSRLNAWERLQEPLFEVVSYGVLVMSALITVAVGSTQRGSMTAVLVLTGAAAAWMLWMVTLHPAWHDRTRLMTVYFVGLVGLMASLVLLAPWFGFFVFAGYLHAFKVLRGRWKLLGVSMVACLAATSQCGGLPRTGTSASIWSMAALINVTVASGMVWFNWIEEELKTRREEAVAELVETNRRLEESLAENAGLHAQLLAQARDAGTQDERQRMAREIHDTLAQGLTGIITQLEAADQVRDCPEPSRRHIAQARTLARESLHEARRSVQALRPEQLEGSHLTDAVAELARRWSATTGVAAQVETTGTPHPVPADVEVALYRTAQESLANVAKHADASRVGITLSYVDEAVLLDVRDDGVGFDVPAVRAHVGAEPGCGFGLPAMAQRLRGVGGILEIESAPGDGTAVSAHVPAAPMSPEEAA